MTDRLKVFVAGGVAGVCAKTAVAPLDRVKILMQAHNKVYANLGVGKCLTGIVTQEGITGLYRGNGAQALRVFPYAATQFLAFDSYKELLLPYISHTDLRTLASGSLAGLTAVTLTYPLDLVRARLAFETSQRRVGIWGVLSGVHRSGGWRGLYRGFTATMIGMLPYSALAFYTFDKMKAICLSSSPRLFGSPSPSGGMMLSVPAKLLCGGLAGAVAQTISYPLDVARRVMQLAPLSHFHTPGSLVTTLRHIYMQHGITRGLYRGLSVNYLRVVPMVSISFCTFELGKQAFHLDTSVKSGSS